MHGHFDYCVERRGKQGLARSLLGKGRRSTETGPWIFALPVLSFIFYLMFISIPPCSRPSLAGSSKVEVPYIDTHSTCKGYLPILHIAQDKGEREGVGDNVGT